MIIHIISNTKNIYIHKYIYIYIYMYVSAFPRCSRQVALVGAQTTDKQSNDTS